MKKKVLSKLAINKTTISNLKAVKGGGYTCNRNCYTTPITCYSAISECYCYTEVNC